MNTLLQLNAQFKKIIFEKTDNFVGRRFVFTAIHEFLHYNNSGYFTLVGSPGSGKTAILAHYVTQNPQTVYYSAEVEGKNRADQFLINVCSQLAQKLENPETILPDNITEGNLFLSVLLQKISDSLSKGERLIIAIDGCDRLDPTSQARDSNIFYLPRYLPKGVYFILARRPFIRAKSGLLIETPAETLNLEQYPEQNRSDAQAYIKHSLTIPDIGNNIKYWLNKYKIIHSEFISFLTTKSENNFMYLRQISAAIAEGFYNQPFDFELLPPRLEAYYHQLWEKMAGEGLSEIELGVLNVLVEKQQPVSPEAIAETINRDEYDVEEVLENWQEFLHQQQIQGKVCHRLYHSSFRKFLQSIQAQKII